MEKLREQYEKEVIPALMKKFNYKSKINYDDFIQYAKLNKNIKYGNFVKFELILFVSAKKCPHFLRTFFLDSLNYCVDAVAGFFDFSYQIDISKFCFYIAS